MCARGRPHAAPADVRSRLHAALTQLDQRVARTPESRDRAVDFLRVAAITVVVLWHWSLSITHRDAGHLVNPNPVEDIAGGWLLTWLFQVMPLFFIIGGYANLTGWDSVRSAGLGAAGFLRRRVSRLLLPALLFVGIWVIVDMITRLMVPGYDGALVVMPIVFTPLWFLGAYLWVTLLVPATATLHRRFGPMMTVVLGAAVVGADVGRFALDQEWLGWVNTAVVWIFVHQLGYLWRDGLLALAWRRWACVAGGVLAVALATSLDDYPRSMVSVPSAHISHMLPTTAVIAAIAVAQAGLATLAAPSLRRWLQRAVPYRVVLMLSGVLLTIFLWHMTALLIVFLVVESLGFDPGSEPTGQWWALRPFWVVAPAVALVALLLVFAPVEQRIRQALSLT